MNNITPKTKKIMIISGVILAVIAIVVFCYVSWAQYHAKQAFIAAITPTATEATEQTITRTNDMYDIKAVYPVDPLDVEGTMGQYVMVQVNEAERQWGPGGELDQSTLKAEDPTYEIRKYEMDVSYKKYTSEKLGTTTYVLQTYQFTGGAHGNTTIATFVFKPYKPIVLRDVLDIDNGKSMTELSRLLGKKLQSQLGEYADKNMISEGLGLSHLLPNGNTDPKKGPYPFHTNFNNFVITDTGLTIILGQYQVAPYVAGMPEVSFTWAELAPYLNPSFDLPLG